MGSTPDTSEQLRMSLVLRNSILNHVFRNIPFSPCGLYVALYSTEPTTNDTGIEISASTGYQRISASVVTPENIYLSDIFGQVSGSFLVAPPITGSKIAWNVNQGVATNYYQMNFPEATSNWGTISHWGIRSGSTGTSGSLYYWGKFNTNSGNRTVNTGEVFSIVPGEFWINMGTDFSYYISDRILNFTLNQISFPTGGLPVYAALYTTPPDRNDKGGVEIEQYINGSPTGYNRQWIGGPKNWTIPSSGVIKNSASIIFSASALQDWGIIRGIGLRLYTYYDTSPKAETGLSNMNIKNDYLICSASFANELYIMQDDGFIISASSLTITLN